MPGVTFDAEGNPQLPPFPGMPPGGDGKNPACCIM